MCYNLCFCMVPVIKEESHNGLIPDHALVSLKPRKRRPGLVSERPISVSRFN